MKKFILLMLCLCILSAFVSGCSSERASDETEADCTEKAAAEDTSSEIHDEAASVPETVTFENPMDEVKYAYGEFLKGYAETHGTENWRYNAAFIDSDDIPELLISSNGQDDKEVCIFSYDSGSGEVIDVSSFSCRFYGDNNPDSDFAGISYLVNENRIYAENYRITTSLFAECSRVRGIFNMYGAPYILIGYPKEPDGKYIVYLASDNSSAELDSSRAQSIVQKFNDEIRSYVPTNSLYAYAPYTYSCTLCIYDPDTVEAVLDDICVLPEFVVEYTVPQPTELFVMEELNAFEESAPAEEAFEEYADCRKAYAELLTDRLNEPEYFPEMYPMKFALAFIDEDNIPELLICQSARYFWVTEIYTYDGYAPECIGRIPSGSSNENPHFQFTPYGNNFVGYTIFVGDMSSAESGICRFMERCADLGLCVMNGGKLEESKRFYYDVAKTYVEAWFDADIHIITENGEKREVDKDEFYNELFSAVNQTSKAVFYDLTTEEIARLSTENLAVYEEADDLAEYLKSYDIDFPDEAPLTESLQYKKIDTPSDESLTEKISDAMTAYREFLRVCAENYDTSAWRFDFAFIDGDDIPELLICLTEEKADTKVQIYYYNENGQVDLYGTAGEYGRMSYIPYAGSTDGTASGSEYRLFDTLMQSFGYPQGLEDSVRKLMESSGVSFEYEAAFAEVLETFVRDTSSPETAESDYYFSIAYIDGDCIPEIIVSHVSGSVQNGSYPLTDEMYLLKYADGDVYTYRISEVEFPAAAYVPFENRIVLSRGEPNPYISVDCFAHIDRPGRIVTDKAMARMCKNGGLSEKEFEYSIDDSVVTEDEYFSERAALYPDVNVLKSSGADYPLSFECIGDVFGN